MPDLKLIALDAEDLGVLSAHLQDAVLKVGDMAYLPSDRRFAAVLNRFDWGQAHAGKGRRRRHTRARTALRFERVTGARLQGLDLKAKDRVLCLLAIVFEPATPPAGALTLVFAGGAAIRLEVECIEGELRDLGAAWVAKARPDHHKGDDDEPSPRKS